MNRRVFSMTAKSWTLGITTLLMTATLYPTLPVVAHPILYIVAVCGFAMTLVLAFRGKDER